MKYLSLFSGIGGFELGIQNAYENIKSNRQQQENSKIGRSPNSISSKISKPNQSEEWGNITCVGYSEIDKYAIQIYQKHYPEHKNYGDITKIKAEALPEFDLLVGGFPCQSFSIAGKRGGFGDTRGTMFFEIARILKAKQPRLLLLENVKGLLSHDEGRTFATIIATLDELGYDTEWQVLNSKNFGVPQNRERVFIVGHLRGSSRPKVFPFGEGDRLSFKSKRKRKIEGGISPAITSNYKRGVHSGGEAYVSKTIRSGGRSSPHGSKQNWDSYQIGTLIRRLTPRECERLQGFPDGWTLGVSDTQRYKTLGNAITTCVVKEIVIRLLHE